MKDYGPTSVLRKVNALSILQKNTNPTYAKRAEDDKRWIQRNYFPKE